MTQTNPEKPAFVFDPNGESTFTPERVIELFGDPSDNNHHEENRKQFLELVSNTGNPYRVNFGLPKPRVEQFNGAVKEYEPSYTPHVFVCDRFILRSDEDPNELLVDEAGLRVLYTHGKWNGRAWVPSCDDLAGKGVTIPRLLSSFEYITSWSIDVVWVCQYDPDEKEHPLEVDTGHPYIYPVSGYARGMVMLQRGQVEVSLNQASDPSTRIEYLGWLAARHI